MGRGLKKVAIITGILFLLLFLFRGWLYKNTVNYTAVGERSITELTDKKLIAEIKKAKNEKHLTINEIIKIAENITIQKLQFTSSKVSNNPNQVVKRGKANCVGYAALFNAIGNYLITAQQEEGKYKFHHLVGKIDFMGMDLHQLLSSSFFKDHDYNEIELLETAEKIYVDPSASDYFGVHRILSRK